VKSNDIDKIFWRYHLLEEKEARNRIQEAFYPKVKEHDVKKQEIEIRPVETKPLEISVNPIVELGINNVSELEREPKKLNKARKIEHLKVDSEEKIEIPIKIKKEARNLIIKENEFPLKVKEYLSSKEVDVFESLLDKKKEFLGKVRINTLFGKQEFFLVAKDKKSVGDSDFAMAHQKAQEKKMLAAVISTGEINKKGKEHLEQWKNMIKWERMNF
jgi:hypothetical protein